MSKDIKIRINRKGKACPSSDVLGIDKENLQGKIIFYFEEGSFVEGTGYLEFQKDDGTKGFIPMENTGTTYELPIKSSLVSDTSIIYLQLRITQQMENEEIPVFKSTIFHLDILEAINATSQIIDDYPEFVDLVTNALVGGQTGQVLKKKSNDDFDTEWVDEPETPTKTSDLENDSGFIDNAVNDLENYTKTSELSEVATSGQYNDLEGKPTKLSDFNNDEDYQTDTEVSGKIAEHNQSNTAHQDIRGQISQLDSNKQNKTDNTLQTTSKQITGAINEVKGKTDTNATNIESLEQNKQDKTDLNLETINKIVVNAINEIFASVGGIQALIPTQASSSNQLGDKNFINSSIATNTAYYISNNGQPFTSLAQLEAYTGTVTNNDYAFITGTDEQGNTFYDRYKATVIENNVSWAKEFRLNNSSFTAVQWQAITSGITALLVEQITTNATNIETIMSDYIKSTDYATSSRAGVIKSSQSYNVEVDPAGYLGCAVNNYNTYLSRSNSVYLSKGTFENALTGKGLVKSTTITSSSTDDNVATPRAVYNYVESVLEDKINKITVASDGTGDYTKVQDAIKAVKNNSKNNQYIIYIKEGNYNLGSDFTSEELLDSSFSGIFVPDFTTLIGLGDRTKVVLYVTFETKHQYISTLNFHNTGGIENLTVIGTKTRYALHDDAGENIGGYKRKIKNCIIKGIENYYSVTCGCGLKEGAEMEYENTIFDGTQTGNNSTNCYAYTIHNNTGFTRNCNLIFKNCRFLTSKNEGSLLLKTIARKGAEDSNNMITSVQFLGCKLGSGDKGFALVEENASVYGSGCLYQVSGYSNTNDTYSITTTDGIDYSNRIDLI